MIGSSCTPSSVVKVHFPIEFPGLRGRLHVWGPRREPSLRWASSRRGPTGRRADPRSAFPCRSAISMVGIRARLPSSGLFRGSVRGSHPLCDSRPVSASLRAGNADEIRADAQSGARPAAIGGRGIERRSRAGAHSGTPPVAGGRGDLHHHRKGNGRFPLARHGGGARRIHRGVLAKTRSGPGHSRQRVPGGALPPFGVRQQRAPGRSLLARVEDGSGPDAHHPGPAP